MEETNRYNDLVKVQSRLFVLAYSFLMLFELHNLSALYDEVSGIRSFFRLLSLLFAFMALLNSFSKAEGKEKIIVSLLIILSIIIGIFNESWYTIVITMLLICSAKGVDYQLIMKTFFVISAFFCITMVVGNFMGFIPDMNLELGLERESVTDFIVERKSFGYLYPTDFANHLFFVVLSLWVLKKGKFNLSGYLLCLFLIYIVIAYTDTKGSAGSFLILIIISLLLKFKKKKRFLSLLPYSIPFMGLLSLYVTIAYDNTNIIWFTLNVLMTGRLQLQQDAFNDAGLTFFGQKYEMYSLSNGDSALFNYVDCSYIQLLIFCGFFYFLFFLFAHFIICRKAAESDLHFLSCAIFVAGINGIAGQWFYQVYYSPFLLLLFANINSNELQNCNLEE